MKNELNIVIPMAGLGSRFSVKGYIKPKPFIDVLGKPMIEHVLENLYIPNAKYFLIVRKEHFEKESEIIDEIKRKYNVEFILINQLTEGSACTVLHAQNYINHDLPLIIANSDQIVDFNLNEFLVKANKKDGCILTFIDDSLDSKWSFVKINESEEAIQVKEKEAISNIATVGIYYFKTGLDFINATYEMIHKNDRVNNEFYTCPVYNYLIQKGLKIGIYMIEKNNMHGIGTPEDLDKYLEIIKNN